ncbi:MAG: hypothetical protein QM763_06025 [Agriterribacter sp.]
MKKKLNATQEAESSWIREWCITIIKFICSKNETSRYILEIYKESFSEDSKNKYLEKASPSIYIKGLQQAYKDTNEWALGLPKTDIDELNSILRAKFGKDLNTYSKQNIKTIAKIVARGKINNGDEFRIINEKVNEICQTNPDSPELDNLNRLLLVYEKSRGTKK